MHVHSKFQDKPPTLAIAPFTARVAAGYTCVYSVSCWLPLHSDTNPDSLTLFVSYAFCAAGTVTNVWDLEHWEALLSHAGNKPIILFLYSKSCGACKRAAARFEGLAAEAAAQRAGVVFAKHNIVDVSGQDCR